MSISINNTKHKIYYRKFDKICVMGIFEENYVTQLENIKDLVYSQ